MGKLGMIGWLGSARRAPGQVCPPASRGAPARSATACAVRCMEARKIRRSERGSRAFFGLLVGCWLVGCRCEPDQPAELALEDCNIVCAGSTQCPNSNPADCASRCQDLVKRGRDAHAGRELGKLIECARAHPCAGTFKRDPVGACLAERRAVSERISECAAGVVRSRSLEGGSLTSESLGCVAVAACVPALDAGQAGGPCQTASTCNGVCCACGSQRTLRVRACVAGKCADESRACALVAGEPDCRAE